MAKYSKVQFIAFNIKPSYTGKTNPCLCCGCPTFTPYGDPKLSWACETCWTNSQCTGVHESYLGNPDPVKDIDYRCRVMKKAIETAYHDAGLLKGKVRRRSWNIFSKKKPVLKVFMAPEFYFRGSEGGYPVENVSRIMEIMREETKYESYKDWLFVFGTAIGYLKHEANLSKILKVTSNKKIEVDDVARDIVEDCEVVGGESGASRKVEKADKKPKPDAARKYYYEISLKNSPVFKPFKEGELVEIRWPGQETEVFNIALIQKGGPPATGAKEIDSSREIVVYKEYVSHIDFLRNRALDWDKESDRKAAIHGQGDRILAPTEGSRDLLAKKENVPGDKYRWKDSSGKDHEETISEESKSGLGGGSVFTIDDITFGLEVCLDHAKKRLDNYYKTAGKPKPHIHLIPSWGMDIDGGPICCRDNGFVFNVDGARSDSDARIMKNNKTNTTVALAQSKSEGVKHPKIREYFENDGRIVVYKPVLIP